MIQDIKPSKFSNEYKIMEISDDDLLLAFDDSREVLLVDKRIPTYGEIKENVTGEPIYIFSIDDNNYFLGFVEGEVGEYHNVRQIIDKVDAIEAFAISNGKHMYDWYSTHNYCGKCGSKLVKYSLERAMQCPNCGQLFFPDIHPAVIIGLIDGDRIMVSHYSGRDYKDIALLAGFCEFGETIEETVSREVYEEVGVKVKNIRYFASQPWGVDSDVLMGFFCDLDGSSEIHVDYKELKDASWMRREDLPDNSNLLSLTATMIAAFKKGKV